jgi:hypothetical protein
MHYTLMNVVNASLSRAASIESHLQSTVDVRGISTIKAISPKYIPACASITTAVFMVVVAHKTAPSNSQCLRV